MGTIAIILSVGALLGCAITMWVLLRHRRALINASGRLERLHADVTKLRTALEEGPLVKAQNQFSRAIITLTARVQTLKLASQGESSPEAERFLNLFQSPEARGTSAADSQRDQP